MQSPSQPQPIVPTDRVFSIDTAPITRPDLAGSYHQFLVLHYQPSAGKWMAYTSSRDFRLLSPEVATCLLQEAIVRGLLIIATFGSEKLLVNSPTV